MATMQYTPDEYRPSYGHVNGRMIFNVKSISDYHSGKAVKTLNAVFAIDEDEKMAKYFELVFAILNNAGVKFRIISTDEPSPLIYVEGRKYRVNVDVKDWGSMD